ncbi:hypothetical protein [Sinomonas sp. G460-2]|uniref:hypothetical protein n=1 Tax=Sinomonas sp. G460-2 TaxID=3393464 RepID=UPI0039F0537D
MIDQDEAQEAMREALLRAVPDGAESLVLRMSILTAVKSGSAVAHFPDGSTKGVKLGRTLDTAVLDRLREVMYRDGSGTWFSIAVTVTADRGMSAKFNYDDEPDFRQTLDPVAYVNDAKKFPRDEAHQPEWLKQRLAEGRSRFTEKEDSVAHLDTGVPGTNWANPENRRNSTWNGRNVTALQNEYSDYHEMHISQEHVAEAMGYQMGRADGERRSELESAQEVVTEAVNALIAESESEIKRPLAEALGATHDDVQALAISLDRCSESPMLGCVYPERVEFGAKCVFCHLSHR